MSTKTTPKMQVYLDSKNRVYAVTYYHGKALRGVAKCAPEDTFDFEIGKQIAMERCKAKFIIEKFKYQARRHYLLTKEIHEAYERMISCEDILTELEEEYSTLQYVK